VGFSFHEVPEAGLQRHEREQKTRAIDRGFVFAAGHHKWKYNPVAIINKKVSSCNSLRPFLFAEIIAKKQV